MNDTLYDSPAVADEVAASMADLLTYAPDDPQDTDGECSSDWPDPFAPPVLTDAEADELIDRLATLDERQRRIKTQAEAMCRDLDRQRERILFAHETNLRAWANFKLRGRSRTVKRLIGSVSFRTVPGRVSLANPEEALEWCRQWCPEAIRETVDAKRVAPIDEPDPETGEIITTVPPGFEWMPPRETFTVKGVRTETEDSDDE